MGTLLRRFWLPAFLSDELKEPDSTPLRLRILGEDLVAFRDTKGRVGIVDAYCAHKRAPLFFGRNEECGLRCVYHGWKFDIEGNCMELPNADNPAALSRIKIKSYPVKEAGGIAWIYMGPRDRIPSIPLMEWMMVPKGHFHVARWLQRTNWVQGVEGELDSSHISFLHKSSEPAQFGSPSKYKQDGAPRMAFKEADYGFAYGARRNYQNSFYWRVTQWLYPMYSCIPQSPEGSYAGYHGRAWVPIDDYHTTTFSYAYRIDRPYTETEIKQIESGPAFPPLSQKGRFSLSDGYVVDTFLPVANKENDYLVDRNMQKTVNYTGMFGANTQDRALQEGMPGLAGSALGIVDRSKEHLVASDIPAVTARRLLIKMARNLQEGIEPYAASNGDVYSVRPLSVLTTISDLEALLHAHSEDCFAPSTSGSRLSASPALPGDP